MLKNTFLAVISIVLFLGACEVTTRLLSPKKSADTGPTAFVEDPVLGYVGRKNYVGQMGNPETGNFEVRHNIHGLRDHKDYGEKQLDVFRIVSLGDSFTWGAASPYEDTYLRVTEKKLADLVSKKVEIVKAGYPGYALPQEVLFFKIYGKEFQPDLVTIGFLPNDLVSVYPLTDDGMGLEKPDNELGLLDPPFALKVAMFLGERSEFYQWLKSLLLKNDTVYTTMYLARGGENSYVSKEWSPGYLEQLDLVRRLLADLKEEVHKINARLLLIFIPQRFQLLVEKNATLRARYQADKINNEMKQLCRELGIDFFDAFPALLEASKQGPVFFPIDGHLNPRGYRIVGLQLAEFLANETLRN